MKYKELMDIHQKKLDVVPIIWAFSDKRLYEEMKEHGCNDISEIISIGNGGYITKSNKELYVKLVEECEKELKSLLENDDEFLKDALIYELNNHEALFTGEIEDAFCALGLDPKVQNEKIKNILDEYFKR